MKHYAASAAAAAALFWAAPSQAVLQFSALVGGVPISCADGQACDLNSAPNVLQTGPITVGGITFLGSSQTQTDSSINTTSFQIDNNTGAPDFGTARGRRHRLCRSGQLAVAKR